MPFGCLFVASKGSQKKTHSFGVVQKEDPHGATLKSYWDLCVSWLTCLLRQLIFLAPQILSAGFKVVDTQDDWWREEDEARCCMSGSVPKAAKGRALRMVTGSNGAGSSHWQFSGSPFEYEGQSWLRCVLRVLAPPQIATGEIELEELEQEVECECFLEGEEEEAARRVACRQGAKLGWSSLDFSQGPFV